MGRRIPVETRFWTKVVGEDVTTCWVWTAMVDRYGYGTFAVTKTKRDGAHRWAYRYLISEIPPELQLDHICRNRACVNPWHLEPVSSRVNTLRGDNHVAKQARQTHCLHGHELAGANLRVGPDGKRYCRPCVNRRQQERRARLAT